VNQKDASDQTSSDNLAVMPYSDSDVCSDANSLVTVYSIVILYSSDGGSDVLYSSSDRGGSLYSVVIRES
jgi:hypothetical protein